ncbi:MAG: hypothetical protein ACOYEV_08085 [Candidatus Nanopelagicales bacterium]
MSPDDVDWDQFGDQPGMFEMPHEMESHESHETHESHESHEAFGQFEGEGEGEAAVGSGVSTRPRAGRWYRCGGRIVIVGV